MPAANALNELAARDSAKIAPASKQAGRNVWPPAAVSVSPLGAPRAVGQPFARATPAPEQVEKPTTRPAPGEPDVEVQREAPRSGLADRTTAGDPAARSNTTAFAARASTATPVARTNTPSFVNRKDTPSFATRKDTPAIAARATTPAPAERTNTPAFANRPSAPAPADRPSTPSPSAAARSTAASRASLTSTLLGVGHGNLNARNVVAASIAARVFAKPTPAGQPTTTRLGSPPPAAALSGPPPIAANAFTSEPARSHPYADLHSAIPAQPLARDAWTLPTPATIDDAEATRPHRTTWLTRARSTIGAPFSALATVIARANHDARVLQRRTQRSWRRMRSELALLALRTHGIVVHKTRGRLGAILLAVAPVLLLSVVAAVWFANRAPVTQASAPVEVIPTEADIARILRSRTGFTVTTEPAGARIHVDGRSTNRITPERVSGFAPGLHSIELKKPGFYDSNLAAVLEEGSTLVLPPVVLKPLPQDHFDPAEQ